MFIDAPEGTSAFLPPKTGDVSRGRWVVVTSGNHECPRRSEYGGSSEPNASLAHHFEQGVQYMLRCTLQRAASLVPPRHTVAVLGRSREADSAQEIGAVEGQSIIEPVPRGSGASALVAASYILEYDPGATLLIIPLDHVGHPEDRFRRHLVRLCALSELFHDQIVVLGATPDGPEEGYSWITPGGLKTPALSTGDGPAPLGLTTYYDYAEGASVRRLFQEGGMIDTGICAVNAKTLWKLAWKRIPETMRRFTAFRQAIRAIKRGEAAPDLENIAIEHLYKHIRPIDFGSAILQNATGYLTVLPMDDLSWSDWRSPSRMRAVLSSAGPQAAAETGWYSWDFVSGTSPRA